LISFNSRAELVAASEGLFGELLGVRKLTTIIANNGYFVCRNGIFIIAVTGFRMTR